MTKPNGLNKQDRQCAQCDQSFTGPWNALYCSPKCRERICETCGETFLMTKRTTTTCSRSCGGKKAVHTVYGPNWVPGRVCEVCDKQYTPNYPGQRTCSRKCGVQIQDRYINASYRLSHGASNAIFPALCAECGVAFVSRRKPRLCCSEKCSRKRSWKLEKPPARVRTCQCGLLLQAPRWKCDPCRALAEYDLKRRWKLRAAGALQDPEPYHLWEIATRDDYRCGIHAGGCGNWVNMTLGGNHPWGPTIDHITPLSVSNDDRRTNVQLMHRRCNETKADHEYAILDGKTLKKPCA